MTSRPTPRAVALVAVGGFVGAVCRHGVAVALPAGVPWGTLAANAAGSFALGGLVYGARYGADVSEETRLLVGTGALSSFTTYSTFAAETLALSPALAVGNVAATYGLGLAGVLAARAVARWAT
mgnify:CR=1 FL=1